MTLPNYQKHPNDKIAVPIKFRNLGANTLSTPAATVTPSGMTATATISGSDMTVLCVGGTDGVAYQVEASCNISNGEARVVEFTVTVKDN
jgi:hypothetical protein